VRYQTEPVRTAHLENQETKYMQTTKALKATLIFTGLGLFGYTVAPGSVAGQEPTIAGTWALNHEDSDDPRELMEEMRAQGAGRGGQQGGLGGGRPDGGGRSGGMARRGDPEQMRKTMALVREAVERVSITYDDSTVTLTQGDRSPLHLQPNWKKQKVELEDIGRIEFKSRWERNELTIERKVNRLKITEWYKPSADGNQLYVITKVEGGPFPNEMLFRRVYDKQ
jgi:hypothetical protein